MTGQRRTPEQVRARGIEALAAALGPEDMVRFLLQFDRGSGDYTAATQEWVDELGLGAILRSVERQRSVAEPTNGRNRTEQAK
jgi:hypothetical protein